MGVLEGVVVPNWGSIFYRPAARAFQMASSYWHSGPMQVLSHFNGGCFIIKGTLFCMLMKKIFNCTDSCIYIIFM